MKKEIIKDKVFDLSFNPKQVVKRLLGSLPDRAQDVIVGRFGFNPEGKEMTLEAIGKKYGVTRERVRQIENYAINHIRKADTYEKEKTVFDELKTAVIKMGGVISEEDLLNHLGKDALAKKYIHFLLVIGDDFNKIKEDVEFKHRWHIDGALAEKIHEALRKLYTGLGDDEIIPESEIVASFLEHLKDISDEYKQDEVLTRWLSISKNIAKNPLGEWGKSKSSNIKTKGVRDYAYLILRRHGSPIHFREVAKLISEVFNKKAHVATTHNELIKDPRFVLVGRGLYALKEWGYSTGVVRDVIKDILQKNGPLSKDQVLEKVLKERYVKPNTVMVNLQNPKYFKKNKQGMYTIV
ncbi:MAG: sigma factor-like helix-turn-helix DNA-binding protein [Candidatus Zambryskibacteria bacterium]